MANLTFAQLEGLWLQAGGSAPLAPTMAAVALAESGGNPSALNPTDNNGTQTSWGLWQISNGTHASPAPTGASALDPFTNAQLAVAKYQAQGLGAWGTYDSGVYARYLPGGTVTPTTTGIPTASTGGTSTGGGSPTSAVTTGLFSSIGSLLGGGIGKSIEELLLSFVFVAAAFGLILLGVTRLFPGVTRTVTTAATAAA